MPQSKQMSAPRRKDDSQANLAQNTILVVSSSDFGRSLAELLTKLEAEVILCKSRKAAQGMLRQRHLDAILTEKYLGSSDPDGGTELVKFIKAKKRKYLATEYPVVLIVAAWSPSFEERTLHLGAMLAEYDYHDILRRLQTALRLAESATRRLPDYEISYQSPSTTDRLVPAKFLDCPIGAHCRR